VLEDKIFRKLGPVGVDIRRQFYAFYIDDVREL
jgi:hypothetical protein